MLVTLILSYLVFNLFMSKIFDNFEYEFSSNEKVNSLLNAIMVSLFWGLANLANIVYGIGFFIGLFIKNTTWHIKRTIRKMDNTKLLETYKNLYSYKDSKHVINKNDWGKYGQIVKFLKEQILERNLELPILEVHD